MSMSSNSPRLDPYLAEEGCLTPYVLECFSMVTMQPIGYVMTYDPDMPWPEHDNGGCGWVETTRDIKKALRLKDIGAALTVWKMQSERIPLRADGKPNRPLTAYSCSMVPLL